MTQIGLIAGNGRFPLILARSARSMQVRVVAVAHQGETCAELSDLVDSITWVRVGELERIIRVFQEQGVRRAVMAGGICKATLFEHFAPDARALAFLSRLDRLGDDGLLRGVAAELEREGIAVLPSTVFLETLLAPAGVRTARAPTDAQWADMRYGIAVARAVGPWDIGQSVVVRDGVVLAVEAIEGTDAAMRRGAALGRGAVVVVKLSKPGQDLRFDVPAIGPETIRVCREVGVSVIAVEAGRSLLLDADELLREADEAGIAVVGVAAEEEGA